MENQYKHLSADERSAIHRGRSQGHSLRAIAAALGRPASTVSREVARNAGGAGYDAPSAQRDCHWRRRRGQRKLAPGAPLWEPVGHGSLPGLVAGADRRAAARNAS